MRSTVHLSIAGAALAAATLAGCGSDAASGDGVIAADLSEWAVKPAASSAPGGQVTFRIRNRGAEIHEFLVVRSDLALDKLPVDDAGDVSEDGAGLEFVDEREGLQPGSTTDLTVNLTPGRYVLLCNLPTHYAQGMLTGFEVTGTGATGTTTPAPEGDAVSDSAVAKGLTETMAAIERGEPAKALYDLWFSYEATIRRNDRTAYLALEDQLAAIRHAEAGSDATAREAAGKRFTELATAYLAAHPG